MRPLALTLLVVGLGGCASQAIDERAAKDTSDLRVNAAGAFVTASCSDGTRFGPNCGLLSEFASTEDFRVRYRDRRCPGHDDEGCQLSFQRAFDSWLGQRYSAADFKEVARTCDLYPSRCQKTSDYELRLLDSHNQHVRDGLIDAEGQVESERQLAQERRRQAQQEVAFGIFSEVVYATHKGPKCRSYPSLFGGVNTMCE